MQPRRRQPHQLRPTGPTCAMCPLGGGDQPCGSGFAQGYGQMATGVLILTEALTTTDEVKQARALAGPGGFLLARTLARMGLKLAEDFRIVPALRCHPSTAIRRKKPDSLEHWAATALMQCAPNLLMEIDRWKPKVILALGETALTALTGIESPMMAAGGYVFKHHRTDTWVVASFDPTWMLQGNQIYAQMFQRDVQKALDIAKDGFAYDMPTLLLDPPPAEWDAYVSDFLTDPSRVLAVDIETPWKRDQDEDDLDPVNAGVDITYTIDRCSVCYEVDRAASVVYDARYREGLQRMVVAASEQGFS